MKKKYLSILTLLGIGCIILIFSSISFSYIYNTSRKELLQTQLESGQREAREIARLLEQQLKSGLSKEQVIKNLQSSILNTDVQTEFICMYNSDGIELCHPDPALVGQVIDKHNSMVHDLRNQNGATFLEWLQKGKSQSGIRSFPGSNRTSEIVNVYPVAQTDWMVALHVNVPVLTSKLSNLHSRFFLIFLIIALILIAACYALVRLIYRKYEQDMETEKHTLNQEINDLAILNVQLSDSRQRTQNELQSISSSTNPDAPAKASKKRMVTYQRDELVKLDVDNIAFVFLRNGITYLNTFENVSYMTSDSLDEIMKDLDATDFYRANRQVIINIRAIKTIQLYGNNQLKLIIDKNPDMEILISKNKVADFKQWLNQ